MKAATDEAMRAHYLKCVSEGMPKDCYGMGLCDLMADGGFDLESRFLFEGDCGAFWGGGGTPLYCVWARYPKGAEICEGEENLALRKFYRAISARAALEMFRDECA